MNDNYSELRDGDGTDIKYRVRDDGEFAVLHDADGEDLGVGLHKMDLEKILNDMEETQ